MKEMILEALTLAKKFYNEELEGNHDHVDEELIRYYQLEADIAEQTADPCVFMSWYGAICWLRDALAFEV